MDQQQLLTSEFVADRHSLYGFIYGVILTLKRFSLAELRDKACQGSET
jgi:hypothetical protein